MARIDGTSGNDFLNGTADRDVMRGFDGNDAILGNNGDDHLIGGNGHDDLRGGIGDDDLEGGRGSDTLQGGSGADTFAYFALTNRRAESDVISDFDISESDRIDLRDFGITFADLKFAASGTGSSVSADLDGNGLFDDFQITLQGVAVETITENFFIF